MLQRVLESERQKSLKSAQNMKFEILTGDELRSRVWDEDEAAYDEIRYLSASLSSASYLRNWQKNSVVHITCWIDGKLAGDLELETSPSDSSEVWFKHVSVRPQYKNLGVGKELISRSFFYAEQHPFEKMVISSFSDEGRQHIKHYIKSLEAHHPALKIVYSSSD